MATQQSAPPSIKAAPPPVPPPPSFVPESLLSPASRHSGGMVKYPPRIRTAGSIGNESDVPSPKRSPVSSRSFVPPPPPVTHIEDTSASSQWQTSPLPTASEYTEPFQTRPTSMSLQIDKPPSHWEVDSAKRRESEASSSYAQRPRKREMSISPGIAALQAQLKLSSQGATSVTVPGSTATPVLSVINELSPPPSPVPIVTTEPFTAPAELHLNHYRDTVSTPPPLPVMSARHMSIHQKTRTQTISSYAPPLPPKPPSPIASPANIMPPHSPDTCPPSLPPKDNALAVSVPSIHTAASAPPNGSNGSNGSNNIAAPVKSDSGRLLVPPPEPPKRNSFVVISGGDQLRLQLAQARAESSPKYESTARRHSSTTSEDEEDDEVSPLPDMFGFSPSHTVLPSSSSSSSASSSSRLGSIASTSPTLQKPTLTPPVPPPRTGNSFRNMSVFNFNVIAVDNSIETVPQSLLEAFPLPPTTTPMSDRRDSARQTLASEDNDMSLGSGTISVFTRLCKIHAAPLHEADISVIKEILSTEPDALCKYQEKVHSRLILDPAEGTKKKGLFGRSDKVSTVASFPLVKPSSYDLNFGSSPANSPLTASVTLKNVGKKKAKIAVVETSTSVRELRAELASDVIKSGASVQVTFTLRLKSAGMNLMDVIVIDVADGPRLYLSMKASSDKSLFGVSPVLLPKTAIDGYQIPTVLVNLKTWMYNQGGLEHEGIFRVAPDEALVNQLKKQINNETFSGICEPSALAHLIKVWFREMPRHLLSSVPHSVIMSAQAVDELVVAYSTHLSRDYLDLFLWLLDLMSEVALKESVNRMGVRALAIVFAPNLFPIEESANPMDVLNITQKRANYLIKVLTHHLQSKYGYTQP